MKEGKRVIENKKGDRKNIDLKKILKYLKIIMFLTMLTLIYFASPHITQLIKNGAMELYKLDNDIITRVVELVLAVILVSISLYKKNK